MSESDKAIERLKSEGHSSKEIQKAMVYITSDTHFGHSNVIKFENRPFKDKEEMDEKLIQNWNRVVQPEDLIFHLGDVFLSGAKRSECIASRLNGRKILILGNHDAFSMTKYKNMGFMPYKHYFYKGYLLTHKPAHETPLRIAVESGLLKQNVHGHTHSQIEGMEPSLYTCVCTEMTNYTPVLFDEYVERGIRNYRI